MEFHPTPNSHDNRFNLIRSKCCWCCCYKLDVEVQFKCLEMMIKGRKILQIGSGTNLRAWACKMQTCHSCHSAATWTATTITTSSPLATARDKGHLNTTSQYQLTVHSQYCSMEQRIDWLYLYLINSTHFYSHASVQFPLLRFVCDLFSMPKAGLDLFSIKFRPPTLFHSLALVLVKSLAVLSWEEAGGVKIHN